MSLEVSAKNTLSESFAFNWNETKIRLLCCGLSRPFLLNIRIKDIVNIIVDFVATFDLIPVCNPRMIKVTSNCSDTNNMNNMICDFRCPAVSIAHLTASVVFKPTINTLLQHSKMHGKNGDSLHLTIILRQNDCQARKYQPNGYKLQCGLACIQHVQTGKNNNNEDNNDDDNYTLKVDPVQIGDIFFDQFEKSYGDYGLGTLKAVAGQYGGSNEHVQNSSMTVNQNDNENENSIDHNDDDNNDDNGMISVETKYLVFGRFYGKYSCRRSMVDVKRCFVLNASIFSGVRNKFDSKHCLKKNHFIQICIERKVQQHKSKNDHDGDDDNINTIAKIKNKNEYQLLYRKGEIPDDHVGDNIGDVIQNAAKGLDNIVWKEDGLLDFDKQVYVFAFASPRCPCADTDTGFLYELFFDYR